MTRALITTVVLASAIGSVANADLGVSLGGARRCGETTVVVLREGDDTVLTFFDEADAVPGDVTVLPLPARIRPEDLRLVHRSAVLRLSSVSAPVLVEEWQQDPCAVEVQPRIHGSPAPPPTAMPSSSEVAVGHERLVLGPHDIELLTRQQASARWPHVVSEDAHDFLVATVRELPATPRALSVRYRSPVLSLPLASCAEPSDVRVYVLAHERFEAAVLENATAPLEVVVADGARARFQEITEYVAHRTLDRHRGAVVTELARMGALRGSEIEHLGADLVFPSPREPLRERSADVRIESVRARGALGVENAERVIRAHRAEVAFCAQQPAPDNEAREGRLELRVELGADGEARAPVVTSRLRDEGLERCVAAAARTWNVHAAGRATLHAVYAISSEAIRARPSESRWDAVASELVLTRLAYRPAPGGASELRLRAAAPRQHAPRFVIRHPWRGPAPCDAPSEGRWGGPPIAGLEHEPHPPDDLASFFPHGVPEAAIPAPPPPEPSRPPVHISGPARTPDEGCSAAPRPPRSVPPWLALAACLLFRRRREPSRNGGPHCRRASARGREGSGLGVPRLVRGRAAWAWIVFAAALCTQMPARARDPRPRARLARRAPRAHLHGGGRLERDARHRPAHRSAPPNESPAGPHHGR
jgi:hypothetical protein